MAFLCSPSQRFLLLRLLPRQGFIVSKRYTNRCVSHHCKFLMSNKSREGISYEPVSGNKSYARKLSSSRKRAVSDTFSRATGVLAAKMLLFQRKQQKTTFDMQAAQPKVFLPKHVSSREQQFQVIPV